MSQTEDNVVGYLTRDEVIEVVARAYYEHFFADDQWNSLTINSIDRHLHLQCAEKAMDALLELLRQNPQLPHLYALNQWFPHK